MTAPSFSPMTSPASITSAADAEALAAHFVKIMDALVDIVQKETDLIRAGRLTKAAQLQEPKADLTRLYIAATLRLRSSHPNLARILPATRLDALRQQHDTFRSLLQINLTVLATAHAVSEGIIRGVSSEMTRKAAPQVYGASGRAAAPPRSAAVPMAISRSL
jgi:hypothetical protein